MTEEEYRKSVYTRAGEVKTTKDLVKFIEEVTTYKHDYGTIVYGCYAAMKAAFNVVNRSPMGGITGFQAGCLGWEAVKEFLSIKGPAKLVKYDSMLYPQYADHFEKTIDKETWEHLQKEAKRLTAEEAGVAHPNVKAHWQTILDGVVPFGYVVKE